MGRAEDLLARIWEGGEDAIDALIEDRQSEELFLDFKQSSDGGATGRLSDPDRKNLAKAISGFGNSEGGLIVWGLDCRPNQAHGDVARLKVKISNVKRFKSLLEGAVSGLTLPPHPLIEHIVIEDNQGAGFVVTSIPKSYLAPHQSIVGTQYYMRAGSNFVHVPHGVLAGMFGRTPQPAILHAWTLPKVPISKLLQNGAANFGVRLILRNRSPAIAQELFVNLTVVPPSGPSVVEIEPNLYIWSASQAFDLVTQCFSKVNFRLAPEAHMDVLLLRFKLEPPFETGLSIDVMTGCGGSPVKKITHRLTAHDLSVLWNELLRAPSQEASSGIFIGKIMGSPEE